MDIFNKKRVEELERELKKLKTVEDENNRLRSQLDKAIMDFKFATTLKQEMPDDCTPGTYCKACEFGKECFHNYHVYTGGYSASYNSSVSFYICTKGETCTNFIQKEV